MGIIQTMIEGFIAEGLQPDAPYQSSTEELQPIKTIYDFTNGVAIVQKMPNAPTERSVNRGGGGFRRGQTLHAIVLSDELTIGRSTRTKRQFLCSAANRSRGFDIYGYPEKHATCPDCLEKIRKYSLRVERAQELQGYL
jgi:hypothetical protein